MARDTAVGGQPVRLTYSFPTPSVKDRASCRSGNTKAKTDSETKTAIKMKNVCIVTTN